MEKKETEIKDSIVHIKNYIIEMPKSRKIKVAVIGAVMILLAFVVTAILNWNRSGYCVLYKGVDAAEASNIYVSLQELGASPKMNEKGEVMVPEEQYEVWLLQMAQKGFPKTTLSYDVFSNNTGLTTTESERAQWLIYQLQDRLQNTLKKMDGVNDAVITITMPENSTYVWQQANDKTKATAGVLLDLKNDATLSADQVSAIKNLVSSSIPQMQVSDVTVVNSKTSLEMYGTDGSNGTSMNSAENMRMEEMAQKQIEDNIVRVLTPRYGTEGVVAVARVTLDYDAMMTEKMELIGKGEKKDEGFPNSFDEHYTQNGGNTAGGIAGEDGNTDIPDYSYTNPEIGTNTSDYDRALKYDYGYIKTQIQKGNATLKRATVSVMVSEIDLNDERRQELMSLISNSTDIPTDAIFVSNFEGKTLPVVNPDGGKEEPKETKVVIPMWVYFAAGSLLFLILAVIIIMLIRKRASRKKLEAAELMEDTRKNMEDEIESYKRQLADQAKANANSNKKDDAIVGEVKSFANENPEITANLLRSWLKDGE